MFCLCESYLLTSFVCFTVTRTEFMERVLVNSANLIYLTSILPWNHINHGGNTNFAIFAGDRDGTA